MFTSTFRDGEQVSSWDVLERIKELILEEPKRITMRLKVRQSSDITPYPNPSQGYPRCGTVGCVGGWSLLLLGMPVRTPLYKVAEDMGLSQAQLRELFYPVNKWVQWWSRYDEQTPKYAQAVAKHITEFQHKYAAQLRNHIIMVRLTDEQDT